MTINEVKNHIKSKSPEHFYIFASEEWYVTKLYIKKIAECVGYKIQYVDSVADLYSKLKVKSLFNDPVVYVVLNDKEFSNTKYETRWDRVGDNIKDDILILHYTDVDKRIKFWKHFKDRAVFFDKLSDRILMKHIQKEIDLSDKNCGELIEICEHDLGKIMLEVDKIKQYMDAECNEYDYPDAVFLNLVREGVVYRPPKDAIFDFVSAVLNRKDKEEIYDLLGQSYEIGEPNMVLLSVLYNNFKALLQVQTCTSDNIGKSTGLNGFQIKNVKPFIDRYTDDELVAAMKLLSKLSTDIKTGQIADEVSTYYFLGKTL